jgi:hypothetical protein
VTIAARSKTLLADSLGLVFVVWAIPVAILIVGTPIALLVSLVIALVD